ncbi:hypothetical protein ABPG74_008287 [Tetrahymena malaccensis]
MDCENTKNAYQEAYDRATHPDTREEFWKEQLDLVEWFKKPSVILDKSHQNPGFWRWYKDGEINICYNAIDRHVIEMPEKPALHWYSAYLKQELTYTWAELHDQVSKLADVYTKLGVTKGDRVIIYMPMVPEAVFGMLASARIGAIHSVVFGGFAAKELSGRITDAKPKLILSASCGIEPHKTINYKSILDEAIHLSGHSDLKVLLLQRAHQTTSLLTIGRDFDYHTAMQFAKPIDCVSVTADHPLYILYTSGTTGQPKGIVRDTGGTCVATSWTMKHIMDIHKGDVYFSGSDIGWVVGHHFIVYGPLLRGATTVLYEGKPTGTPDPGCFWRLIEKYKVKGLYTAPTALRAIRRDDLNGDWIRKFDTSSLQNVSMAGERCDVPTYEWIQKNLGVLINDNYWQTEIGWIISCNYKNLYTFPVKPGSAVKPAPGFKVEILDQDNHVIEEPGKLGRICIKLPMPPSFMLTLYNNDEAFIKKYLADAPGYYQSGDCGYFDSDGYLNVMTRLDDIINTAGHRLSTAAMEESLLGHDDVVEAAVVSKVDDFKGEIPIGFVVIKQGRNPEQKKLEKECIDIIRKDIGPVASFHHCIIVEKLPKTRSGKTLRHTLKKIVDGQKIDKIPPTIEDASVLEKIEERVKEYGLLNNANNTLVFRDQVDKVIDDIATLTKEEI